MPRIIINSEKEFNEFLGGWETFSGDWKFVYRRLLKCIFGRALVGLFVELIVGLERLGRIAILLGNLDVLALISGILDGLASQIDMLVEILMRISGHTLLIAGVDSIVVLLERISRLVLLLVRLVELEVLAGGTKETRILSWIQLWLAIYS